MSLAKSWTVAVVMLLSLSCSGRWAMGQVLWVADNNQLRSVDLGVNPQVPGAPIAGASAYRIAVLPGGQKVLAVDRNEMLQSVVGGAVRQMQLAKWRGQGGIAITPDGARAYLPVGDSVAPVDLVTNAGNWAMPLIGSFRKPWDIAISPDGKTAYVSDTANNKVVPIDLATGNLRRPYFVYDAAAVAITPDGKKLYVAGARPPAKVTPVDLSTGTVSPAIALAEFPANSVPGWLVADPNIGGILYVGGASRLVRIHTGVDQEDDPISLGLAGDPPVAAIAVSPNDGTVYLGAGSFVVPVNPQTEHAGAAIAGFTDVTSVAFAPPVYKGYDAKVYFLGDSVTAGFGYCGQSDNGAVLGCAPNDAFTNSWWNPNQNSLGYCAPPQTPALPTDRCSNNHYADPPWSPPDGGKWVVSATAPHVAYSYVIAVDQGDVGPNDPIAEIRNWAMTGAEPTHWDPGGVSADNVQMAAGAWGPQLQTIRNSYVVMTLGANPLLGDYLHVYAVPGFGIVTMTTKNFDCAATTLLPSGQPAPLNTDPGGVGNCLVQQWGVEQQAAHLYNIYDTLLRNDNRVLVVGYPPVCPWSLGMWQPAANFARGPSSGDPCNTEKLPPSQISQEDQAFYLADIANALIKSVVDTFHNPNIAFVPPSSDAKNHQFYSQGTSWVFGNDTWIHPSADGHRAMATGVERYMCLLYQHWCPTGKGNDVRW